MDKIKILKYVIGLLLLIYSLGRGLWIVMEKVYMGYDKAHVLDTPLFWIICAIVGALLMVQKKGG
jgi:hypothetical protein